MLLYLILQYPLPLLINSTIKKKVAILRSHMILWDTSGDLKLRNNLSDTKKKSSQFAALS